MNALIQFAANRTRRIAIVAIFSLVAVSTGQGRGGAEETPGWGDLQIRFTLEGERPATKQIDTSGKPECAKLELFDETLVVGAKSGIKNVFVWLVSEPESVHPDVKAAAKNDVTIHIINCRFEPRMTVVQAGQILHLKSSDPFGHSPVYNPFNSDPNSRILPAMDSIRLNTREAEVHVTPLSCSIHPWMKASVFIRPNLYASVSNRDGVVTISKLPVGHHTFCAWNERYLQGAKVNGKDAGWKKGRFVAEIKDGETTRFDVTVSPEIILGRAKFPDR